MSASKPESRGRRVNYGLRFVLLGPAIADGRAVVAAHPLVAPMLGQLVWVTCDGRTVYRAGGQLRAC